MRTADATLLAHLNSSTRTLAFDLWTITLQSGTVLRWTDADAPIKTTDARTFTLGPTMTRDRVKWTRGLSIDHLRVTMGASSAVTINTVPLIQVAAAGGFDAAVVQLERVFLDDTLTVKGQLVYFNGVVADVDCARSEATMMIDCDLKQLDTQMPRNLFQAGCLNNLYDPVCAVRRATYAVNLSVSAVDPAQKLVYLQAAYSGQPSGWFALGILQFTSGPNVGISRTVKSHTNYGSFSDFLFARPFPFAISPADAFTVWPGCDKTQATCSTKYGNLIRFRATPYVPNPETVF